MAIFLLILQQYVSTKRVRFLKMIHHSLLLTAVCFASADNIAKRETILLIFDVISAQSSFRNKLKLAYIDRERNQLKKAMLNK